MDKTATWQAAVLAHFTPKHERLLLAIDPDNLLRDDTLLAEIQNRNYDVLELADEVTFRDLFERTYRSRWDDGDLAHVIVVVHTTDAARHIPYDLWMKSKRVELSVSALFPNLNAIVVRDLDNAYYADLYPAHQQLVANHEMLRGERPTIEFILRSVFGLDPLGAADPERWVEFLIHKHYSARQLPPALETYVVEHLLPRVRESALRPEFLADGPAFYAWLGEQWTLYIAHALEDGPKPPVDFADARLRPLLGYLFAEGLVARAPARSPRPAGWEWLAVGLAFPYRSGGSSELREDRRQELYNLQARLAHSIHIDTSTLPGGSTDLRDWLNLGADWAEIVYLANSLPAELYGEVYPNLFAARQALEGPFWEFIQARYSAVDYYEDNRGPIGVTAINRWLQQNVALDARQALICFDGMALDQWHLMRGYLASVLPDLAFEENRAYAVAPTLTPVSRQALFAGRPPAAFAGTLDRTDQDGMRWEAFWVNHNVPRHRVAFAALSANDQRFQSVQAIVDGRNRRLGLLINLFDDVMHQTKEMPATADKRVYYATLRSHLQNGRLERLFELLLENGYRVFVTADHGNIAGTGVGLTPPKALVDTYARRVAVFDSRGLAEEYAQTHALRVFRTKALPPDVWPVYIPGAGMFAAKGATQVSHGGLSLEELVVPFVEVKFSTAKEALS